jgi:hypothetical protein
MSFDLRTMPRCNARTRRGAPRQHAGRISNGRCRLHGGASLIKHGRYSNRASANCKLANEKLRDLRLHDRDPEEWARKHGIDLDALQADPGADED